MSRAHETSWLAEHIRDVPDFPKPGIVFKDLTPLLADVDAFRFVVDVLADRYTGLTVDRVIGIEARGFIVGAPVAYRLGAGFIPVRKAGKLPWDTHGQTYALEYGDDRLEIHRDAIEPGQQVLVVDDVLATGGTAAATVQLVERLGGQVVGLAFVLELAFLAGRKRLDGHDVVSLIRFD